MAQALAEIGDAWSLLILRETFYGRQRFSDIVEHTGAQKTVVSARLKQLVNAGILVRETYSEFPTRHNYVPTQKGAELGAVVMALTAWGTKWLDNEHQDDIAFTHRECGHDVALAAFCPNCDTTVQPDQVRGGPRRTMAGR